jgi:hypothetical protein
MEKIGGFEFLLEALFLAFHKNLIEEDSFKFLKIEAKRVTRTRFSSFRFFWAILNSFWIL